MPPAHRSQSAPPREVSMSPFGRHASEPIFLATGSSSAAPDLPLTPACSESATAPSIAAGPHPRCLLCAAIVDAALAVA
ncbi:hypothetical protein B0H13DRAFT_2306992 [Mycena leptocephala]|nr:hypothetical protein B0H13DRAFT_2306992 [Mycena leptocephala]